MEKNLIKLKAEGIRKSFFVKGEGNRQVLEDISFQVRENEFLVILGPGLCGKTVLLNILTGLLPMDSGQIITQGQGQEGKISMVFQKTGLFPWKTVMENVELGPKLRGDDLRERRKKAQHYIDLVGLTGFENSYPGQLSGGMKQRAGIARAYTNDPDILVMDEPFGQLDAQTRYQMQSEILRIWEQEKRTILFVTNNIEEACTLGDRIILLSQCPARVKDVFELKMPHPRDTVGEEFLRVRKRISDEMDLFL